MALLVTAKVQCSLIFLQGVKPPRNGGDASKRVVEFAINGQMIDSPLSAILAASDVDDPQIHRYYPLELLE